MPTPRKSPFPASVVGVIRNHPKDSGLKRFLAALGAKGPDLEGRYAGMSESLRSKRFGPRWSTAEQYDGTFMALVEAELAESAKDIVRRTAAYQEELRNALKEYRRLSLAALMEVLPKTLAQKDAHHRALCRWFDCCDVNPCPGAASDAPPESADQYGLRVTSLHCGEAESYWPAKDHTYYVAAVVDGSGNTLTTISPEMIFDDGDSLWPRQTIYPIQDPGGFLDVAIHLYENDGGYEDVAAAVRAVSTTAGSLALGDPVGSALTGAAVELVESVAAWISDRDPDDNLGLQTLTFDSAERLQASVGFRGLHFDTDAATYRMTVELQAGK